MKVELPNPMPLLREQARRKVDDHFHRVAQSNAHEYHLALVDLVRGKRKDHPIDVHERRRGDMMNAIEQASSAPELDAILKGIE